MNQRIKELYKQALENKFDYSGGVGVKPGEYYSNYKTVLNAEKFAELIVRECASKVTGNEALNILEHFGVEESKPQFICPKCGVDRLRVDCPNINRLDCGIKMEAQ